MLGFTGLKDTAGIEVLTLSARHRSNSIATVKKERTPC